MASILKGERVALNFLQHLSGIATETNRYVQEVTDYDTVILDTRKTAPGLRSLQKYAVAVGGGTNHRRDLSDGVLIKDNHLAAGRLNELSLGGVVRRMRDSAPSAWEIEVEVETLDQVREAVDAGADIVMLDNMSPSEMAEAVRTVDGRALTEASGGITLDNVREVAATGVDRISVGALTHSVTGLDISLELLAWGSPRVRRYPLLGRSLSAESIMMVTGPSLVSDTIMYAWKTPVSTRRPVSRNLPTVWSNSDSARSGPAA